MDAFRYFYLCSARTFAHVLYSYILGVTMVEYRKCGDVASGKSEMLSLVRSTCRSTCGKGSRARGARGGAGRGGVRARTAQCNPSPVAARVPGSRAEADRLRMFFTDFRCGVRVRGARGSREAPRPRPSSAYPPPAPLPASLLRSPHGDTYSINTLGLHSLFLNKILCLKYLLIM